MRLYQCPACDCLPVRYKRRPISPPKCVRCSRTLVKVSRIPNGFRWGLAAAVASVGLLFAPHLYDHLHSKFMTAPSPSGLSGSVSPLPAVDRTTLSFDRVDLFTKLEEADAQWHPQEELMPDGSIRYHYKRRAGESDLSLAELRSLVNDPPSFDMERKAINTLLETLRKAGVQVMLVPTVKKGAAAEWDHQQGILRIQPHVMDKGSKDFLRVLNHEAIHVAQSCRAGSLTSKPRSLNLSVPLDPSTHAILSSTIYFGISNEEKVLEEEAYALQDDTHKAHDVVSKECKTSGTALLQQG
jgi:ribosomal protein L34E